MRNLKLQRLLISSDLEKGARIVQFHDRRTVIFGENDTGKSCLIKSIYAAFGADAYKTNDSWNALKANLLVEFTVNDVPYRILRSGSFFALFDGHGHAIWSGSGIISGIGPQLAQLLDFKLTLSDRQGNQVVPPPAFCFLPFYVDQDIGWLRSWASFAGLGQFENPKRDVAYFHAGLRPNEYYIAKAAKFDADRVIDDLKVDRRALNRAAVRLKSGRGPAKFDLMPEAFASRIDALLSECQAVQDKRDQVQRGLADLHSRRAALLEQSAIAGNALAELDADYEFIRKTADTEIICPTCGTAHSNDFANKFGLISDAETCRGFLLEVRQDLNKVDDEISLERTKLESLTESVDRINAILNEQRGELKFRDLIEGESERMVDDAIAAEQSDINTKIGEQDARSDEALATMKSFEDKKFQKAIKDRYLQHMKQFVMELQVPGLSEKSYKQIDCAINETGSDLPRALLAYYYAFVNTMRGSSASVLCPLVVDSPVQQDQDPANATRMIEFALERVPEGMQLILGSVSLHGAAYDGYSIKIEGKRSLLGADAYDEVAGVMKPYYDALIRPQTSP
ncbi:hypothetical protein HL667_07310 [Bradyrhizobium sp. 83012]|uniref:Rad50/SbcC-type AAA domain-containing protein n=1 Tax=Bradyrhizobium aeschynomenes TaxID=2734909 RepID=A0ABX2CC04_9BRAD|nr:hypothetical protein [Bradyrhizobium aeschynomenes]NPU64794.1 hypothetical protein [Bradyrhizobium aeschynomenes]